MKIVNIKTSYSDPSSISEIMRMCFGGTLDVLDYYRYLPCGLREVYILEHKVRSFRYKLNMREVRNRNIRIKDIINGYYRATTEELIRRSLLNRVEGIYDEIYKLQI